MINQRGRKVGYNNDDRTSIMLLTVECIGEELDVEELLRAGGEHILFRIFAAAPLSMEPSISMLVCRTSMEFTRSVRWEH